MGSTESRSARLARLVRASRPCKRCGAPAIAKVERGDTLPGSWDLPVWDSVLVCADCYPAVYDAAPPGRRHVTWLD